jgi:gastrin-releasing peptide receptor
MIHHTITFVAITTLHLAFVTFTMDIYRTDAAIWSQTETTTDWQDHSDATAYQQMVATETPESFTNVASIFNNELNISLENLLSAFSTSSYVSNCSGLQEQTDADEFNYISYDVESPDELLRTTWELNAEFNRLIKTALWFICTGNTTVGYEVITMSRIYDHNFTEFMVRLNGSTAAIDEVTALDTVADLYRTSIQQVESVMEYLTDMISEEGKIVAMVQNMSQQIEAMNPLNEYSLWETILGTFTEVIRAIKDIFERARNMSEQKDENPFINVISSSNMSRFLDPKYWAKVIEQEPKMLDYYQTQLREAHHMQFLRYKVTPVIVAVVLVVGMTGNGLLLTVFVIHKETRTLANSMLINLTVVDFVSLVVNGLLEYLRVTTPWQFDWLGCKLFNFVSYLLVAVSTYSVAMISVQRFVVIKQLPSLAWCHQSQKTKYVLIAAVWGIGCVLSVHHAVIAHIKSENCKDVPLDDFVPVYTADFITFCVVPLLITAVFSGVTAYRIRSSIRRIPGEATGQQQLQHSRMVSSAVLFALTGLYVVSYAPFFLYNFLVFVLDINVTEWEIVSVNVFVYYLRFVNCCLNPIVLFVLSKRYRGYIKTYCGQREVQPASKSGSSIETSLSA